MATSTESTTTPSVLINYNPETHKGHYIAVPRFWVDEFFGRPDLLFSGGEKSKGTNLPASFWTYTLELWRWISIPVVHFQTERSMDEFGINKDAATQWTAAYRASGVVKVELGKWTARHDVPTVFTLLPDATHDEWRCFLRAVHYANNALKLCWDGARAAGNTQAWTVLVAKFVQCFRRDKQLPTGQQEKLLQELLAEKNAYGNPVAYTDDKHEIQPIFYRPVFSDYSEYRSQEKVPRRG